MLGKIDLVGTIMMHGLIPCTRGPGVPVLKRQPRLTRITPCPLPALGVGGGAGCSVLCSDCTEVDGVELPWEEMEVGLGSFFTPLPGQTQRSEPHFLQPLHSCRLTGHARRDGLARAGQLQLHKNLRSHRNGLQASRSITLHSRYVDWQQASSSCTPPQSCRHAIAI